MGLTTVGQVASFMGIAQTEKATLAFLTQILPAVEAAFTKLTDRDLALSTRTVYLSGKGNKVLPLPEYPVVSITGVWLDSTGYWGGGANAFASATQLTDGVDFALVRDGKNANAEVGRLYKISGVWPGRFEQKAGLLVAGFKPGAGNVKVAFTAGYASIPADVQLAIWETCAKVLARRTVGAPIQSEGFEEYNYSLFQQQAEEILLASAAQVLARHKRITLRHEVLG